MNKLRSSKIEISKGKNWQVKLTIFPHMILQLHPVTKTFEHAIYVSNFLNSLPGQFLQSDVKSNFLLPPLGSLIYH